MQSLLHMDETFDKLIREDQTILIKHVPVPIRNDEVDFGTLVPDYPVLGGVGHIAGITKKGIKDNYVPKYRTDAKSLEEALQIMNTIRTERGLNPIPL